MFGALESAVVAWVYLKMMLPPNIPYVQRERDDTPMGFSGVWQNFRPTHMVFPNCEDARLFPSLGAGRVRRIRLGFDHQKTLRTGQLQDPECMSLTIP